MQGFHGVHVLSPLCHLPTQERHRPQEGTRNLLSTYESYDWCKTPTHLRSIKDYTADYMSYGDCCTMTILVLSSGLNISQFQIYCCHLVISVYRWHDCRWLTWKPWMLDLIWLPTWTQHTLTVLQSRLIDDTHRHLHMGVQSVNLSYIHCRCQVSSVISLLKEEDSNHRGSENLLLTSSDLDTKRLGCVSKYERSIKVF